MKLPVRSAVALAAAGLLAAASMAGAAPAKPLVLTDQAGDANGVNGQGLVTEGPEGTAGGPSQAQYDIKSVTFAPLTKGKTCLGYTATMELTGPASLTNTLYRIQGVGSVNTALFWLQFQNNPVGGTSTTIRHSSGTSTTTGLSKAAVVQGNKITWTVTKKDLKATGEKETGTVISALGADVRTSTGVVTVPMWDQIPNGDKSITVC